MLQVKWYKEQEIEDALNKAGLSFANSTFRNWRDEGIKAKLDYQKRGRSFEWGGDLVNYVLQKAIHRNQKQGSPHVTITLDEILNSIANTQAQQQQKPEQPGGAPTNTPILPNLSPMDQELLALPQTFKVVATWLYRELPTDSEVADVVGSLLNFHRWQARKATQSSAVVTGGET